MAIDKLVVSNPNELQYEGLCENPQAAVLTQPIERGQPSYADSPIGGLTRRRESLSGVRLNRRSWTGAEAPENGAGASRSRSPLNKGGAVLGLPSERFKRPSDPLVRSVVDSIVTRFAENPSLRDLDLSGCDVNVVDALPDEVVDWLGSRVTSLRLPTGLTRLPPWVARLSLAEEITMNGYRGTRVVLATAGLRQLEVSGPSLREIQVPEGTKVYCRHCAHREKIDVRFGRRSNGGNAGNTGKRGVALGHIDGAPLGDRTAASMSEHMSKRCGELMQKATDNYLVGDSQWGNFLADQFMRMDPGEARQLVCSSGGRAVLLELEVRQGREGGKQFVFNGSDPGTGTHVRFVDDDVSEIARLTAADLLSTGAVSGQRGGPATPGTAQIWSLMTVPGDLRARPLSEPLFETDGEPRGMREFLSHAEALDPTRFSHLLQQGLPLDGMREALDRCVRPEQTLELLAARNASGTQGLALALWNNQSESVAEAERHMLDERRAGRISSADLKDLLFMRSNGSFTGPGTAIAFMNGCTEALEAHGKTLLMALAGGWLTATEFMEMLYPVDPASGQSAREFAMQNGHQDIVAALDGIVKMARDKDLLGQPYTGGTAAKRPNANPFGSFGSWFKDLWRATQ